MFIQGYESDVGQTSGAALDTATEEEVSSGLCEGSMIGACPKKKASSQHKIGISLLDLQQFIVVSRDEET